MRLEGCFAVRVGGFPVHFRTGYFGERAPVTARFGSGERLLQHIFVLGEKRMCHGRGLAVRWEKPVE